MLRRSIPKAPGDLIDHACLRFCFPSLGKLQPWKRSLHRSTRDLAVFLTVAIPDVPIIKALLTLGFAMRPFWLLALILACTIAGPAEAQVRVLVPSSSLEPADIGGQGYSYDVARAIAQRAGYTREFEFMPWVRAISIAEASNNVLLLSVVRTPKREQHFQWLIPIAQDDYVLVSQRPIDIDTAAQHTTCVLRGSAVVELAQRLGHTRLVLTVDEHQSMLTLRAGRCDAWMVGRMPAVTLIRESGLQTADFHFSRSLQHLDVYIAGSLIFEGAEARRWQAAFEAIRADGTFDAIRRRYKIE